MSKQIKSIAPVQKRGDKWVAERGTGGWDVRIRYADGTERLLCDGTAPYTLAQAQVAADSARRDESRHGLYSHDKRIVVTLANPWTGALIERDVTELTQAQLEAYPLDDAVCAELQTMAPCSPAQYLAAYVDHVGAAEAGRVIIGS